MKCAHILEQHYAKAIQAYTLAIENNPAEASYYGNRSFAYIKSEFYGKFNNLAWDEIHTWPMLMVFYLTCTKFHTDKAFDLHSNSNILKVMR